MIPIKTSIRPRQTPYANYALIVANFAIFFITYAPHINPYTLTAEILRPWAQQLTLNPTDWYAWQFVSYAFLHASYLHIGSNMLFLYLFGNNVNDELGTIGYLLFYLLGAIVSGLGHMLTSSHPVLGASGAVAAVTGAYLVLLPQSLITIVYWFLFVGTMEIPAIHFILIKLIIIDNIIAQTPYVAYNAHLAGYAFGITAVLASLAIGLIKTNSFNLWTMIKQWNRRRLYRDAVSGDYDPFSPTPMVKRIKVKEVGATPQQKQANEKINQLRTEIVLRISERNLPAAAETYLELIQLDPNQVLPRHHLLDIANQLASTNHHREAAGAYEKFLDHYASYEYIGQVELMLALLYSRYLNEPQLAIKHLRAASKNLSDQNQLKMCTDELSQLERNN